MRLLLPLFALFASAVPALAEQHEVPDFTGVPLAWLVIVAFAAAYGFVIWGERHELKKSVPVLIGAGVIWTVVALVYIGYHDQSLLEEMNYGFEHSVVEIGELTFFLITAMTYVITLEERNVFEWVRFKMLAAGLSQRMIFWATGTFAFFLSPFLDNLTTALALVSVVIAVGAATRDRGFVVLSAINLVVAANAGGAFSPFGDITTLMVWQAGKVDFFAFYALFVPALVNWGVPAVIMSFAIKSSDAEVINEPVVLKKGAVPMIGLFALTLFLAVTAHVALDLPPVIGMTTGLGLLMLYGYFLQHYEHANWEPPALPESVPLDVVQTIENSFVPRHKPFDTMHGIRNLEWDTLLFFFGILTSVAGLAQLGFLLEASRFLYGEVGATVTNSIIGLLSAIVDNIPVMSAVLIMDPAMNEAQWMLVTLTTGVGGSLLSIGSAAGVALMGAARMQDASGRWTNVYTFMGHLKWTWAIALGYVASIYVHILMHTMT